MSPQDNCPFANEVQDLYDGVLEADRVALVRAHLTTCMSCAQEYAVLSRLGVILRESDPAPPAPDAARARMLRAALLERSAASLPHAPEPIVRRKVSPARPRFLFGFLWKVGALAAAVYLYSLASHDISQRVTPTVTRQVAVVPHPVIASPAPVPSPQGRSNPPAEIVPTAPRQRKRHRESSSAVRIMAHTSESLPTKPIATTAPTPTPEVPERIVIIADAGTTKPEPELQPRPAQSTIIIAARGEATSSESGSFAIVHTTYQETQP